MTLKEFLQKNHLNSCVNKRPCSEVERKEYVVMEHNKYLGKPLKSIFYSRPETEWGKKAVYVVAVHNDNVY